MRIVVDASELTSLAAEYGTTAEQVFAELEPVVEKGALNVKNDARDRVRASITGAYLPHYPRSIDYDIKSGGDFVEAEIGPNPDFLQGGMGRGVEYGSARTGPIPHLDPAYEEELPRFEKATGDVLMRGLP